MSELVLELVIQHGELVGRDMAAALLTAHKHIDLALRTLGPRSENGSHWTEYFGGIKHGGWITSEPNKLRLTRMFHGDITVIREILLFQPETIPIEYDLVNNLRKTHDAVFGDFAEETLYNDEIFNTSISGVTVYDNTDYTIYRMDELKRANRLSILIRRHIGPSVHRFIQYSEISADHIRRLEAAGLIPARAQLGNGKTEER